MRYRAILTTVFSMILLAAATLAVDVSGKWTASMPGRDGNTREVTYTFKADGDTLTGTATGMGGREMPISEGKVSGDEISFKTKIERNGNTMVMNYKGKVSGGEIRFTVQREGGDQSREFTAKRAQ